MRDGARMYWCGVAHYMDFRMPLDSLILSKLLTPKWCPEHQAEHEAYACCIHPGHLSQRLFRIMTAIWGLCQSHHADLLNQSSDVVMSSDVYILWSRNLSCGPLPISKTPKSDIQ